MATKKERQIVTAAGLGLAAWGLYSLMRARKVEDETGFFGAPLDDDTFHGAYGSADDSSLWSDFPSNPQWQQIPQFPTSAGYLRGMAWTPYGPILTHPGRYGSQAHPGLSYSQWLSINLHRHENPDAVDGFGDLGAYGDACSRLQTKYRKKRKHYRKKERQYADRGRRFLGIRVGDGTKRLAKLKKKYQKIRQKAQAKGCEWPGARQRRRELQGARQEEQRLEAQMAQEFQESQENIARVSEQVAAESSRGGVNPLLIVGGVGLVAVVLFLTRKKGAA